MAEPDDKAFLKEFGGYKPQTTSVPVATIRPVISFESEEEVAARRADEARKGRGAEIEEERLDISKRAEATGLEDTRRKGFLDLVTKYEGDANVVKYQKVLPIYNTMLTVASKPNPSKADDNLLVTYFSKIKDPATGVLGGEFETSKDVQTAYDKAVVDLQGLYDPKVGFVSPAARRQFIRATMIWLRQTAKHINLPVIAIGRLLRNLSSVRIQMLLLVRTLLIHMSTK
jgi:hypothetical protein